jgi:aryl-alcohol dehydrogenase
MQIQAAVAHRKGAPFSIEAVELAPPGDDEVLIQMVASGICHTDLSARDQEKPVPLPAVFGHEGAGIVLQTGRDVTTVQPGDHVVLSYGSCGACSECRENRPFLCRDMFDINFLGRMPDGSTRLRQGTQEVSTFFAQSSFATYAVATQRNTVKVDPSIPLSLLAPLGCGVQTGSGVVFNRLKPDASNSIVVFGCGTVGLSAIMAAHVLGCHVIVGVDLDPDRLALALDLGATHVLNPTETDVIEAVLVMLGTGADYAIDAVGSPNILRQCVDVIRPGGVAVLVGGTPVGTEVSLGMQNLLSGRTVTGVTEGDSVPQAFIPQLIALYQQGQFPFDKLIRRYPFEQINQAVEDMKSGKAIKPVLVFST